jgi:hypothetical protein
MRGCAFAGIGPCKMEPRVWPHSHKAHPLWTLHNVKIDVIFLDNCFFSDTWQVPDNR